MKNQQYFAIFLLAASCLTGMYRPTLAQAQAKDTNALEADATLTAKVSFEVKRQPLRELIATLQEQSGVTLSIAPDAPSALVTARVKELPLSEVMNAFSRVYGVEWNKSENGYRMSARTVSDLERKLLQTGNLYWYRFDSRLRASREGQEQANSALAKEIYDAVGDAALRSPEGVLFSDLPEELQTQIRTRIETESGGRIFQNYLPLREASSAELSVHLRDEIQPLRPKQIMEQRFGRLSNDKSGLRVETPDGRLVTRLFPALAPERHVMLSLSEIQQMIAQGNKPVKTAPR